MAKSGSVEKQATANRKKPAFKRASISAQLKETQDKLRCTESLLRGSYTQVAELGTKISALSAENFTVRNLRGFINSLVEGAVFKYNSYNNYLSSVNPARLVPGSDAYQELCDYTRGLINISELKGPDRNSSSVILIDYIYSKAIRERIRELLTTTDQNYKNMIIAAAYVIGYDYAHDLEQQSNKPDITWLIGKEHTATKAA